MTTATPACERHLALERSLMRIRWFGVAFGFWQVAQYRPVERVDIPSFVHPLGYATLGWLALMNGMVWLALRNPGSDRPLRRLGATMFGCDILALIGLTWIYSFEQFGFTWVILYILPIEGALRYQLIGAAVATAATLVTEPLRDLYRNEIYGYRFQLSLLTFRIGIVVIVGWAVGALARRLERESAAARVAANRERTLHQENQVFHDVLLAGVSSSMLREALQSMVERIATDFGYGSLSVLLPESDGRLHPVASYGLPQEALGWSIARGEGISGTVASTGKPLLVSDVTRDPRYFQVDPATRSELAVPVWAGGQVAGVLSAESRELGGFDAEDVVRLERIAAYMALVIDNSRLLAQERASVERLRELDTMKSDFVAITSHELRTPLTAMRGFIKTLRRPDLDIAPDELAEFLAILDRQSDRLARLVEDLLIVSRIDAGALHLRMEPTDVEETLRDMLLEVGQRANSVRLVVDHALPRIVTDSQRLGQIARNLVENAVKFSPHGSVVRLTAVREGGVLVLEVTDKGPGIPPEEVHRVFERFHQVGGSLRRRADGFGLGLYITKRLVEALGGEIECDSELGRGTTFRVRLPLAAADDEAEGASETA